mgnify:CR=1 FL=1
MTAPCRVPCTFAMNGSNPQIPKISETQSVNAPATRQIRSRHALGGKRSEDPAAGCPSFFERELRYLRVPIYDSPAEDAGEHFAAVLDFISSRLHHGGVLVHCLSLIHI